MLRYASPASRRIGTGLLTCSAALALLLAPAAGLAQSPASIFPDTPEGRAAAELLAALNSGDEERRREYVARRLARPDDEATLLAEAWRQGGGADAVRFSGSDGSLRMTLRSRRGDRWASAYAALDGTDGRLLGFGIRPMLAPPDTAALAGLAPADAAGRYLDGLAARDDFSGVVLVESGGRPLLHRAYGMADRARGAPVRPETRFHVASTGKMFTAVAIGQLVEEGRLRFADTLGALLPDYPNEAARRTVTVHHLLTHTSGLGGLFDRPGFDRRRRVEWQREHLAAFAAEPLAFAPGVRDQYSNEGYVVLGAIVERLSGMPFERYLEERVFAPAGMRTARCEMVGAGGPASPDAAVNYATPEGDPFGVGARESSAPRLGWECGAAGGEYLAACHLLAFARALREGRLLSPATMRVMMERHGLREWRGYGFERHERRGYVVNGHGGSGGLGISAELRMVMDGPGGEPLTVVVLSNYDAVARPVADALLDRFLAPARN